MFWLGLFSGVAVMLPLVLLRRRLRNGGLKPAVKMRSSRIKDDTHWSQIRNFLYYDGTQMPINKEEQYE